MFEQMGIRRLLNDGTYTACFPLHEGPYNRDSADGTQTDRRVMYSSSYNVSHGSSMFITVACIIRGYNI